MPHVSITELVNLCPLTSSWLGSHRGLLEGSSLFCSLPYQIMLTSCGHECLACADQHHLLCNLQGKKKPKHAVCLQFEWKNLWVLLAQHCCSRWAPQLYQSRGLLSPQLHRGMCCASCQFVPGWDLQCWYSSLIWLGCWLMDSLSLGQRGVLSALSQNLDY